MCKNQRLIWVVLPLATGLIWGLWLFFILRSLSLTLFRYLLDLLIQVQWLGQRASPVLFDRTTWLQIIVPAYQIGRFRVDRGLSILVAHISGAIVRRVLFWVREVKQGIHISAIFFLFENGLLRGFGVVLWYFSGLRADLLLCDYFVPDVSEQIVVL